MILQGPCHPKPLYACITWVAAANPIEAGILNPFFKEFSPGASLGYCHVSLIYGSTITGGLRAKPLQVVLRAEELS